MRTIAVGVAVCLAAAVGVGIRSAQARKDTTEVPKPVGMKQYPTKYYKLFTDLSAEKVSEARIRLTLMAEEYWSRTKTFGGVIREPMDFYIFQRREDYLAAGAPPGSAGVFMSWGKRNGRLMAYAAGGDTWRIVQHEGFHQFVHMTMPGEVPIWVNEGLADYFGCGVWTGDAFVLGVIPPDRQKAVVQMIEQDKMMSMVDMLKMTHQEWNMALQMGNYIQAWSMVHFLAHAEKGKYQAPFASFIRDVANRQPWEKAWIARFGRDTNKFRDVYAAWWKALPENPTAEQTTRVVVHSLTSFMARGVRMKLQFKTAEEFFAAAREGKIKLDSGKQPAGWLPEGLLTDALGKADGLGTWSLETKGPLKLVLTETDGGKYVGSFASFTDGRFATTVTYVPVKKPADKPAEKTGKAS